MRRKQFLFDAADRQHLTAQRDLAGHRNVPPHGDARQCGSHCRRHRDTGRRSVFRNRAFGNVNVQIAFTNEVETHAEALCSRLNASQRGLRRLLHHIAEFAGQRYAATTLTSVASICSTSPPISVHASPVASPISLCAAMPCCLNLIGPSISRTRSASTTAAAFSSACSETNLRASLRQHEPISRSRLRTPASRV